MNESEVKLGLDESSEEDLDSAVHASFQALLSRVPKGQVPDPLTSLPVGEHEIEVLEVIGHGTYPNEWTIVMVRLLSEVADPVTLELEQHLLLPVNRYDIRPGMKMTLKVEQVARPTVITAISVKQ